MNILFSTLNQISVLFCFIALGYVLARRRILPEHSATVLAKLENAVFIPALIAGTFAEHFTPERIAGAWQLLLASLILALAAIPLSYLAARLITKDPFHRRIFTYGLCFSNFGFMGNAVVLCLFEELFFEYLLFTLPLWILIYTFGVPHLLAAKDAPKPRFFQSLRALCNPMFFAMALGMLLGLLRIPLPPFFTLLTESGGACMSPVAMLLTGIVISRISVRETFGNGKIYLISLVRLLGFPALFLAAASLFRPPETLYLCALCALAMPLGLNTIIVPSARGEDTSVAAGMTVVSHLFSAVTIPLLFTLAIR